MTTPSSGKGRGFLSMTPEQRRQISSLGGKRAHELGKANRWTSETAREAGRKGGAKSRRGSARKPAP